VSCHCWQAQNHWIDAIPIERSLDTWQYHGFPVVRDEILLGYVAREKLKSFIGS
jgi:hypothetical protein